MKTLLGTVDQLAQAMTYHRDRHAALAGNLANLDTPGYKPIDLVRDDEAAADGGGLSLARTDPNHLSVNGTTASASGSHAIADDAVAGADGNAVNLEHEMAKLDANRVRYATSGELVSRRLALLKYAAGDGNG